MHMILEMFILPVKNACVFRIKLNIPNSYRVHYKISGFPKLNVSLQPLRLARNEFITEKV